MRRCRLHVMGASGSGTTTLARTLASYWSVPHADADDYFWVPTDPPHAEKRREAGCTRGRRCLWAHEEWLAEVGRPVLTLDSAVAPEELRDAVLAWEPGP